MKRKNNKGITLIALVVTIVILLILAGITIATLFGENGVIKTAEVAKEEHRGATVKEQRDLWKTDKILDKDGAKTLNEVVQELINNRLVTEDEGNTILDIGIITIGSHVIDFRDESVDLTGMAPGLYETGTKNMIYSWEELKNNGDITLNGNDLVRVNEEIAGELVISNEVVNIGQISPYQMNLLGSTCGGRYSNITAIYIKSNVKKIYNCAFEGFKHVRKVYIEYGLEEIGESAFANCNALQEVSIPNSIISIKSNAFGETFAGAGIDSNYNLKYLYIPDSVINIESYIFTDSIEVIYCERLIALDTWNENWNIKGFKYREVIESDFATVKYGYTRAEYENEIGIK